jgi:hypothetical protein
MKFRFNYTNHKSQVEDRTVNPTGFVYLTNPGATNPHLDGYTPGWFLQGMDLDRGQMRTFKIDPIRMRPLDQQFTIHDTQALEEAVKALQDRIDNSAAQIEKLADFILAKVPGEPSQNEGAVDTVIRVLSKFLDKKAPTDDVDNFAMWLTTRPAVLEVGASKEVPPMIEALTEYKKLVASI